MKVCELIEWLKREDPLSEVEIEVLHPEYYHLPVYVSPIAKVDRLLTTSTGEAQTVRLTATRVAELTYSKKENTQ